MSDSPADCHLDDHVTVGRSGLASRMPAGERNWEKLRNAMALARLTEKAVAGRTMQLKCNAMQNVRMQEEAAKQQQASEAEAGQASQESCFCL